MRTGPGFLLGGERLERDESEEGGDDEMATPVEIVVELHVSLPAQQLYGVNVRLCGVCVCIVQPRSQCAVVFVFGVCVRACVRVCECVCVCEGECV